MKNKYDLITDCFQGQARFAGLTHLDLRNNAIAALRIGAFSELPALTHLDLRHNSIGHVPNGTFAGLKALKSLALGSNKITAIPDGIFAGLKALSELGLGNNSLTTIPQGIFSGLKALETLYIGWNGIASFPDDTLGGLAALRYLALSSNPALPCVYYNMLESLRSEAGAPLTIDVVGTAAAINSADAWSLHAVCPEGQPDCHVASGPGGGARAVTLNPPSTLLCMPSITVHCCVMLSNRTVIDCSQCSARNVTHVNCSALVRERCTRRERRGGDKSWPSEGYRSRGQA